LQKRNVLHCADNSNLDWRKPVVRKGQFQPA
jgi:hypothetical protein